MFAIQAAFEFGGEVTADGGSDLLVEAIMHVSVEHGGLADSRFSYYAKLDYDILIHVNNVKEYNNSNKKPTLFPISHFPSL